MNNHNLSRSFLVEVWDYWLQSLMGLSTRGPGKRDTCHHTDFFHSLWGLIGWSRIQSSSDSRLIPGVLEPPHQIPEIRGLN